jgi:hypothetical protein
MWEGVPPAHWREAQRTKAAPPAASLGPQQDGAIPLPENSLAEPADGVERDCPPNLSAAASNLHTGDAGREHQ